MVKYHFVFCPKYRKPIFADLKVKSMCQAILEVECKTANWQILAVEVMPDHLHLLIEAPNNISPSEIANQLKGTSAKQLRETFPYLKKAIKNHLWAVRYYVSGVGDTSQEQVKKYIALQEVALARKKAFT
jgi:putative transposase